jgi:hypothetical protein
MRSFADGSVYRHLEREYVRKFFKTGELMLTTLPECRNHEKASRKDPYDGLINFSLRDGSQMLAGLNVAGSRSYVLCASRTSGREIHERLSTDSWIEIKIPGGFAEAVGKAIPCTGEPLLGDCRYVESKEVNKVAAAPLDEPAVRLFEEINKPGADPQAALVQAMAESAQLVEGLIGGDDAFFEKHLAFEVEREFRFVWPVGHAVTGPARFLIPDAIQFCEPGPLT